MNKEDLITSWYAEQTKVDASIIPITIGDDMAQVRAGVDGTLLITTDMLLDGVHFDLASCTLEQAGYKAMAASLSDCAAMATVPVCAVGATALPAYFTANELKELHKGTSRASQMFNCPVIGGDITKWRHADGRFAVAITMLSRVSGWHEPVRRSGARPGDIVCVTGTLGGSLLGKHLSFTPRVNEALAITKAAKLNSMMDISDGLSTDLSRICTQSAVGAILEAHQIPQSKAVRKLADPLGSALHDGEDFELLFTLSEDEYRKLPKLETTSITRIGVITEKLGLHIRMSACGLMPLEPQGFDHL
ncbi:MAG: thiamine-phosphate kinase [Planctomycetaceae bacterium]|nr:thiamine-phosphate kinase [Planctomycetaceae bacterium]